MTSFLRPVAWLLIATAIVAPIAMGMNTYYLHILNLAWIFAIAALGLSVATGVAGQIVLGQAALVGIGAYATALLMMRLSLPWWLALMLAMMLTGAVGAALGLISTRIKGHYLAIVTLALNEIFRIVAVNEEALTGGPMGLRNIPTLSIPGLGETVTQQLYLPLAGLMFASYALMILFHRSALGRELRAVRDDEMAAEAMGVNSVRAKTIAFMICSLWAALSGGLYVLLVGFVAPTNFTIAESIKMMLMVVLGGLGSVPGTMLGAIVVTILPEALRDLQTYYMAAFGAAVVVIMLLWPKGLGVFADWLWGSFLTGRREPEMPALAGPLSLAAAAAAASSALAAGSAAPDPSGSLMRVRKVSRSFGGVRALNDVSFDVMRGEILGLIGPNGSGKSTMINACSGVVVVDGSIELESHPLQNRPAWEAHAHGVARIFQNVRLWESMTVLENVMVAWRRIPGQPGGEAAIREASLAALEQMGVRHLAMRQAGDLSFGQSRLVEMARAIVGRPKVLLLDEPAAGLRGGLVLELSTILQRLRAQGMTILVVEHRIKLVTSMCDRVVVLNLGDLIADGAPATVMESPAVIEAYLGERAGEASDETRARRIRRRSVDHVAAHG
ncbi:branched-chain amino acid ABC transporter ATP-binding protein/permease [Bradyrhizobium yuanmingense]|uniref:branched-chain amino acid ABC transporter ATP-binding protein/permease n=1 Tax=Bradyrhizobium yuanmingense TaxID=108015 RepID=UPI0023B899E5|nr:branched-chain amino acid ABC transporter ATP-binding protein/permease [Bradyrhizobium yuanmingense]MDF0520195.1 branched-chain amino acid ABC transporter ATP-binding protein/permease [Bradyrhizobium yuanmingense]